MVTNKGVRNGHVFGAVADPTRRQILDLLHNGPMTAGSLAERFPVSRPAISRHLRILRQAGLVSETRRSQMRVYRFEPEPLAEIDEWLSRHRLFWSARLHDLKDLVEGRQE